MTMLKAITKGITILTAASSLLAGLPCYDCLCASAKSCSPPAATQAVAIKASAAAPCCCCGGCGHESGSHGSCCDMTLAVEEKTDCSDEVKQTPVSNSERPLSFGCRHCSSPTDMAFVPGTAELAADWKSVSAGWLLHYVPIELPTAAPCSPFRWKQYQLPPPPDLIITLQHYLI
ncbi:MAG TPA: hypothetical protein VKS79_10800 [Gemmataceae bacterium]|nr:hypothetical protein [Gemmataceae bacterium]